MQEINVMITIIKMQQNVYASNNFKIMKFVLILQILQQNLQLVLKKKKDQTIITALAASFARKESSPKKYMIYTYSFNAITKQIFFTQDYR